MTEKKQPKKGLICMYKFPGETPLESLHRLRIAEPQIANETLSYAGRLDPMAEGLLLVLVGEENKKRESYLHLDKVYEATALLGIETDSYDILGKITHKSLSTEAVTRAQIEKILSRYVGQSEQPYPPYSSKPINGKPLFQWARENALSELVIPTRAIHIFSIEIQNISEITALQLRQQVEEKIDKVTGDFRQQEIIDLWRVALQNGLTTYQSVTFTISCSTGTYIRSLIHNMGRELGIGATTLNLKRVKLGDFDIKDVVH
jgi:tRNA pseudouridine55 synthase